MTCLHAGDLIPVLFRCKLLLHVQFNGEDSVPYYANKRDIDERALIDFAEAAGFYCHQMPREVGFDLLVVGPQVVLIVEVKNEKDPPSKQALTDREREVKRRVEHVGGAYYKVSCLEEFARLLNVPVVRQMQL